MQPADVADAIVDALEVGRFDVWVPKFNGGLFKVLSLVPRTWREAIGRLMKVDKLMTDVDHGARNAYEERLAQGEAELDSSGGETAPEPAAQRDAA